MSKTLPIAASDDFLHHGVRAAHLALVLEFQFAGDSGQCGVQVADARQYQRFAVQQRAPFRIRDDELQRGDRQTLAHAAALVDSLVFACGKRNLLHDLPQIWRNLEIGEVAFGPGLLGGDGQALFDIFRIVRANLRADAILERRNDFAARRVILRIGGEDERDVEFKANGIALNLYVALPA